MIRPDIDRINKYTTEQLQDMQGAHIVDMLIKLIKYIEYLENESARRNKFQKLVISVE